MKFLLRVLILAIITGVFVAAAIITLKATGQIPWLNRHHGIVLAYVGSLLSLISTMYTIRKNTKIIGGPRRTWLRFHIIVGSVGLLLVLVHGRFPFRALVPGLSEVAMALVGITGLFGWYMYLTKVQTLLSEIKTLEEAEELFLAGMASTAFRFWRFVHILATFAALFFTIIHVISLIVFRGQY